MAPDGTNHGDEAIGEKAGVSRSGAETAELIAECAAGLFAEKGYAATSIREITEAAKVTKPTLYYHFGSKDGLIRHLIEGTLDTHARQLQAMVERTDHEAALVEFITEQLEFGQSHPSIVTLFVRLDVQRPANLGIDLEAVQIENHLQMETFFANGIAAGTFRGDPRFLAMSFVGMMISHLMVRVRFPDTDLGAPVDVAHSLVSLLLDGARAPDGSGPSTKMAPPEST